MIGRTNAGGGAGGGLNFKVVGGTSTPASTKENTIWVNTDTAIPSWHFGVDEPNFYNLKTRTEGDAHTIMAPRKVSAGDILNFKIPKKVLVTREAICIRCPETGKSYYVRNGNGTAAGSWSAGTTVGVLLSDTSMPVGSYGSGSGTALIRAWEKCYHTEGTLWIQSGASSPVAFNALKKNGITVYPISAKQYVSGAWVDKTAKSYQGGAWVDWITSVYLFSEANGALVDLTILKGQNAAVTIGSNNISLTGNSAKGVLTGSKITFAKVSTLYVEATLSYVGTSSDWIGSLVVKNDEQISPSGLDSNPYNPSLSVARKTLSADNARTTYSLSVPAGSYYVGVAGDMIGTIHNMWYYE